MSCGTLELSLPCNVTGCRQYQPQAKIHFSFHQLLHPPAPVSPPPPPLVLSRSLAVSIRFHLFPPCAMFRPAARALARAPAVAARGPASTRLISTGPAPKSRGWKNYAVRLGLAAGAVYYYNTSSVFAQEPSCTLNRRAFSLQSFPGRKHFRQSHLGSMAC